VIRIVLVSRMMAEYLMILRLLASVFLLKPVLSLVYFRFFRYDVYRCYGRAPEKGREYCSW